MQLFELFFDEEAYELILQKTMLYVHIKGEDLFMLTIPEFQVVFGISPVSGLVPVPNLSAISRIRGRNFSILIAFMQIRIISKVQHLQNFFKTVSTHDIKHSFISCHG